MESNISHHKLYSLGKVICYLVFFGNILALIALFSIELPSIAGLHLFERHHLNIFLFIVTGGCLLAKYKHLRFFRIIGWYAGFILFLSCLLLFVESVIYSNFITNYFDITDKTSPLSTICFVLIAFSLLDLSIMDISKRLIITSVGLIILSIVGILLNVLQVHIMISLPLYSAINFILLSLSLLFLYTSQGDSEHIEINENGLNQTK